MFYNAQKNTELHCKFYVFFKVFRSSQNNTGVYEIRMSSCAKHLSALEIYMCFKSVQKFLKKHSSASLHWHSRHTSTAGWNACPPAASESSAHIASNAESLRVSTAGRLPLRGTYRPVGSVGPESAALRHA